MNESSMKLTAFVMVLAVSCGCIQTASGEYRKNKPNTGPIDRQMTGEKGQHFELATRPAPESAERIRWFKEAKLGMFIHWGVYSTRGGFGPDGKPIKRGYTEWYQKACKLDNEEYAKLADEFNPVNFNAEAWVKTARSAGMKYITITAKHHDGFCIFDSAYTTFDIMDATPFKRDALMELREACDKHGLKLIYYYSHVQDWEQYHAWETDDWIFPDMVGTPLDHEKYLTAKSLPQVEELLTKYRADGIWFDTPRFVEEEIVPISGRFTELVRRTNPDALVNSRVTHIVRHRNLQAHLFDYISLGDQKIPQSKMPMYAEVPDSIHRSYGYDRRPNVHYKGADELLPRIIMSVARGANSLINVGPDGSGEIPGQAQAVFADIGDWMETNGEAVYGTEPTPYNTFFEWGEITVKNDRLYLHILDRSHAEATLPLLAMKIRSASVLGSSDAVNFKQSGDTATVTLPEVDGDLPYVIRLQCDAPVALNPGEKDNTQ